MQRYLYDVGDKAYKLFAWLDRRVKDRRGVWEIRGERVETRRPSVEIAEAFALYYEHLYASIVPMTDEDCDDFLKDIVVETLFDDDRSSLKDDLSVEEIGQELRDLQLGKASGPNGLPVELYRGAADKVVTQVPEILKEALADHKLPVEQCTATTVVTHKQGEPEVECQSVNYF
ncbi:hypothetical protein NDU88_002479 [Pleurodeles waltl]|uniref:Uncharacterized protein n=1 Tax=Pleurodeles waltl TaxID=8319 RepID=A0AAV7LIX4_PLEWA|nr:hypothetical protein NDU88_002479 [Pleurodeles waltl]